MGEEIRKEEQKCGCGCASGKIIPCLFKVVLGLAFLALGAMALLRWWGEFISIVKGCAGLFFILAGLITLAIAKE